MRLEFRPSDAGRPPASELIDAVLDEYDAMAGRSLSGGPSAEPRDFAAPAGVFLVGYLDDAAVCCGGVKALGEGVAEIKRMYVVPAHRGRGVARALLSALEHAARDLGHRVVRLDSTWATWQLYEGAGYRAISDYNDNPHADVWGEKRL